MNLSVEINSLLLVLKNVEPLSRLLSLSSFERKHKLVVFWCADRMNSEASNKILKMVEEPGKDTTFVFITDEINKIIPTLVSRCQTINFNGIEDFDLMSQSLSYYLANY